MNFSFARKLSCLFFGAFVMSLNVAAQPANQPPKPTTPTAPPAAGSSSAATSTTVATTVSKEDREFIDKLARGNIAEIETGKLAVGKSTDANVKTFAQQMVDDHSKALNELSGLAMSKGVTLPNEPDDKHKKAAEKLSSLSADKFDKEYVKTAGVNDHKDTVSLLKKMKKDAKDPDLRGLAEKMLPTVEHHLKMAEELYKQKK